MISTRGEVCSIAYGQKVIKIMNTYFIWAWSGSKLFRFLLVLLNFWKVIL